MGAPRPSLPGALWPELGHPPGARPSARSLRTWPPPPPPPPPPGPSPGGRASASWRTGAGSGPREACPLGGGSSGSRLSPMAPPPSPAPRPCARPQRPPFSLRTPGPAKLVSPLWGGASSLSPAAAAGLGLGAGPAVRPPFVPPGGGEGLDGEPLGGHTRPSSCLAPSVRAGGRWAPRPSPERVPGLARPATWQLRSLSAPPAPPPPWGPRSPPRPIRLASFSRRPPPAWPPPGVGDRASP